MNLLRKSAICVLAIGLFAVIGCEKDNNDIPEEQAPFVTNFEKIQANLEVYMQSQGRRGGLANQYACSEQGGTYTPDNYVNHQVYLNEYYVPDFNSNAPGGNRYATWMTNLQDWLMHDFNDTNPGGSNSYSIDIYFDVYGANGGTVLNATDGNRAYNEFVCQMMDQLNLTSASQLNNYTFSMSIIVDYFLCCNGSSCCEPVIYATGIAYSN